jgi:hypothetical protein
MALAACFHTSFPCSPSALDLTIGRTFVCSKSGLVGTCQQVEGVCAGHGYVDKDLEDSGKCKHQADLKIKATVWRLGKLADWATHLSLSFHLQPLCPSRCRVYCRGLCVNGLGYVSGGTLEEMLQSLVLVPAGCSSLP